MAEQDDAAYAKNKAWGEQKEHEAADILESVYPELMIRRTDITGKVIPYEQMRTMPSQPNLQIFHQNDSQLPPIIAWCESTRRTLPELAAYFGGMYVKLKTLNAMQPAHYLLKPCINIIDDRINDIIAIKKPDMAHLSTIDQSRFAGSIGKGWNARVAVAKYSRLYENKQRTADTFLEALLATTEPSN